MSVVNVADSLKMIRESLCVAQTRIGLSSEPRSVEHVERIGRLIADIDRQRPLGSDGKHGDLHTADCGCEAVRDCDPTLIRTTPKLPATDADSARPTNPPRCRSCGYLIQADEVIAADGRHEVCDVSRSLGYAPSRSIARAHRSILTGPESPAR